MIGPFDVQGATMLSRFSYLAIFIVVFLGNSPDVAECRKVFTALNPWYKVACIAENIKVGGQNDWHIRFYSLKTNTYFYKNKNALADLALNGKEMLFDQKYTFSLVVLSVVARVPWQYEKFAFDWKAFQIQDILTLHNIWCPRGSKIIRPLILCGFNLGNVK